MSRYVRHPSAFLALGLATLGACVDAAPPEVEPDAEPAPVTDGLIACGALGRVEIRDGKVMQDDMVFGSADRLAEICDPAAQGQLFGVGREQGSNKWPGGVIPYRILPHVPYNITQRISEAIVHWEGETAIDFVPFDEDEHTSWVDFDTSQHCHANVGREGGRQHVWLTDGKATSEIRAVAIAGNDWVYTWYSDGSVTAGTSIAVDAHRAVYEYSLPPGYAAANIVEMAINSEDKVYTWWSDGKVSIGTSSDLDAYQSPQGNWQPAPGRTRYDVVGIGISGSDTVHAWYDDGTRSIGNSLSFGTAVTFDNDVTASSILGVDFSSNNTVYTFYVNNDGQYRRVTGTISDQATSPSQEVKLPRNCSVSAIVHELGHTVGLMHEQSRCDRDNHVRVYLDNVAEDKTHNFDKACGDEWADYRTYDFASVMHYDWDAASSNGRPTILKRGSLADDIPTVIDMAIASDDHVYTWWEDGTVTAGTSDELERYRARYPFVIPAGRTVHDIEGIAIASDDRVYTYYDDGHVSVGTTANLGAHVQPYEYTLAYKSGNTRYAGHEILAVGISEEDNVYVWYEDGHVSWGTSDFPGQHGRFDVTSPYDTDLSSIKGIDISSDDTVYTWYQAGRATRGTSTNLHTIGLPYDVRGKGTKVYGNAWLSNLDKLTVSDMY